MRGGAGRLMADYDVVWNGAHRDCDADLLAAEPVVKRSPPPLDRSTGVMDDVVLVLRRSPLLTMAEIAIASGLTTQAVNSALHLLRIHGVVEAIDTLERRAWGGTLLRYRYTGDTRAGGRVRGTRADRSPIRNPRLSKGAAVPAKADRSARRRVPAR
jgi:hypothetical protein